MKKAIAVVLLIIFILAAFTGCRYKEYSGKYVDLYTVAINSVLWTNGHSFSADKYTDSQIEVIEKDMYGRTLFTYYEKYYAGADISFSALIICQSSNENEVFYYENINFIVKHQDLYTQNLKSFEAKEIEALKAENDWNKEIKLDKCVKKEMTKSKPSVPHEEEIKNKVIDEFHLKEGKNSIFITYLTKSSIDSNYIVYGYIYRAGIYFVGLVESDGGTVKNISFFVPTNTFNYKDDFVKFKEANNWK